MFDEVRENAKSELLDIIDSLRGLKCLVVQTELEGLLNQVIVEGSKALKDIGVEYFRELRGELGDFSAVDSGRSVPDNIIYLVRPCLSTMKLIANQIHSCNKSGIRTQYHIYFVPYRTVACEQMLEDEGILDICEIGEFPLGMVPFDTDLLSLEMGDVFKQCYVDGDTSSLNVVANALHSIQEVHGIIPNVKSKGAASRKVLQSLLHIRCGRETFEQGSVFSSANQEFGNSSTADINSKCDIDTLVLLDREVDLVSPLISPLTYEGLIDDLIGIENGKIVLDASVLGEDKEGPTVDQLTGGKVTEDVLTESDSAVSEHHDADEKMSVALNNSDVIFAEIRDLSIERLGSYLQEKAIRIKERYATFRDNKDASITEIHDFVKKIPNLTKEYKSLNQHINIAELLKTTTDSTDFRDQWQGERGMLEGELFIDQIEDIICADAERNHLYRVLRLLCIQSITAGGIRSNRYDNIRRLIVQTYGYDHLFTLSNLERAGFLKRKDLMLVETASPWQGLRKQFKLIEDKIDGISYVSAGYAPLSVRIVQYLVEQGWKSMADVMRLLPGEMLEFTQISAPEELPEALRRSANDALHQTNSSIVNLNADQREVNSFAMGDNDDKKKVMMVMVIGGLSFVEIAAYRMLSNDPKFPYQIIMATTKLCNGSSLLKSAAE